MFLNSDSRTAAILQGDLVAILKMLTCKQTVCYLRSPSLKRFSKIKQFN